MVSVPPSASSTTIGTANSSAAPRWAMSARRAGPQVVGVAPVEGLAEPGAGAVNGALLVITQITEVKWWFSFEKPAQNQSAIHTAWAAGIQFEASAKTTTVVQ